MFPLSNKTRSNKVINISRRISRKIELWHRVPSFSEGCNNAENSSEAIASSTATTLALPKLALRTLPSLPVILSRITKALAQQGFHFEHMSLT
jgi:hypothetical protein